MDRQAHEYASAMAFAQQQKQQQADIQQQQHFGFPAQPHQFPQQIHGPPFMPPHPPMQQFYHHLLPPQQQPYPQHHLPPHLQQQQPPPHYPPHLPPHLASTSFIHPFDSPPPPAMPPADPELHKIIDKLAEYSAKNGPEFEAMIREKQQDNPDYSFLFGGEGHNYYRYKLWLFTKPPASAFNSSFPSSMPTMPSSHSPLVNQTGLNAPPHGTSPGPPLHQPSLPYFDQHQQLPHSQLFLGQDRSDYDASSRGFKGLSGPLPSDVAAELNGVLSNLTGTKESIKGAKMWFMQRSPFAPALAEALQERIFAIDDSERQLHIIFLANDILFDSLQRRTNPQDLDNEALAFKPVLGSMLSRIYNNPHNKEANQSRLEKILQFWASKEVYDQATIASLEREMTGGFPLHLSLQKGMLAISDPPMFTGQQPPSQWPLPPEKQQQEPSQIQPIPQPQQAPQPAAPPYPLFPPGLIPGMVRKMQIGSGVPYSPMSPLDIPTAIPPPTIPESEILDRVSNFFKEIGEAEDDDAYEREKGIRKGGACIPPPASLQAEVDPEMGGGSGRLGLGATANPNEASQYDDVYGSYRKQRSTSYHSSMGARASTR